MSVVVIGLQHTQAPLPLLEAVAVSDADLHKTLSALNHRRNVQEAVVLSTCLRTEVYAVVDRFHDAVAEIYEVLSEHSHLSVEELSAHAILRFDDDVTSHLFSVTSGLESVVTGETEVVGQVRRAFERAQEEGASGPVLNALFRHALQTGKRVRTETGISKGTTSFAYAAVTVARGEDQAGLRGARVVVVGAGDMGLGVCRALSDIAPADAPQRVVVVNRSAARARDLVRQAATGPFEMRAAPLERVAGELADADVVLTAVAAESHVLQCGGLRRGRRPAARDRPRGAAQRRPRGGRARRRHAARHGHLERLGGPCPGRPPGGVGGRPRHRRQPRSTAIAAPAASAAPLRSSRRCAPASRRCASPSWSAIGRSWPT